jgi:hypothetical protein
VKEGVEVDEKDDDADDENEDDEDGINDDEGGAANETDEDKEQGTGAEPADKNDDVGSSLLFARRV